jgi:hypothetical protein
MINFYYYQGQLRQYMLQFCNIFAGLKVETGKGVCDVPEFITVPIRIGNKDRVVAALESGNTQNKLISLPQMAASMSGLRLNPAKKGLNVTDTRTYLPEGGIFPTDLRSATRIMPVGFIMEMELVLYSSNTEQMHQMLEQILMLFNPSLQIQTDTGALNWAAISLVELIDINNEENYPPGTERRYITWTLTFELPIYISAPMNLLDDLVKNVKIRIGDMGGFSMQEYDENGDLVPFKTGSLLATAEINTDAVGNATRGGSIIQPT